MTRGGERMQNTPQGDARNINNRLGSGVCCTRKVLRCGVENHSGVSETASSMCCEAGWRWGWLMLGILRGRAIHWQMLSLPLWGLQMTTPVCGCLLLPEYPGRSEFDSGKGMKSSGIGLGIWDVQALGVLADHLQG
jgi:hypothetical protein